MKYGWSYSYYTKKINVHYLLIIYWKTIYIIFVKYLNYYIDGISYIAIIKKASVQPHQVNRSTRNQWQYFASFFFFFLKNQIDKDLQNIYTGFEIDRTTWYCWVNLAPFEKSVFLAFRMIFELQNLMYTYLQIICEILTLVLSWSG